MTDQKQDNKPLVAVIMGSQSDWDTMKHAADVLGASGLSVREHRVQEAGIGSEARGLGVLDNLAAEDRALGPDAGEQVAHGVHGADRRRSPIDSSAWTI